MNIETPKLVLRAVEPKDARFLADLVNDPEAREGLGPYSLVFPMSVDMEERWIDAASKTSDSHMIITLRSGFVPIGLLSLRDHDKRNGSMHLNVILQKKNWDKGYGTEAVSGVLKFLFDRMNLHRVWLRVPEHNKRAIKCFKKCGFKFEGTLREDHFTGDEWHDSQLMSVLVNDFGRKKP